MPKVTSEFLHCPRCHSGSLKSEQILQDRHNEASRNVTCENCDFKWVEVFVFSMALDYESECPLDENGGEID